jgi:zinc transport system permease protein
MDFIRALGEYGFLRYALVACLLAGIGCGTVGAYVVVKRIGFLAGGIAHALLAGMGIAFFLQSSPLGGALVAALVSAALIAWIKLRWRQDEDVLIAGFWSVGMAIGILFISRAPGYAIDLTGYLFGNILMVSAADLKLMAALDAVLLAAIALCYRQFLAILFDEEFARVRGLNVELHYMILLCLVALTVVLLIQIVGLILVMALLVLPAAAAAQFTTTLPRMMIAAVLFSVLATVSGLWLSYAPDLPSGATMVVVAGIGYLLALAIGALRRRRGAAH